MRQVIAPVDVYTVRHPVTCRETAETAVTRPV